MAFNIAEDSLLIELVGQHPCLYDLKCENYKNHNIRENVWAEISKLMEKPAETCKKRWKSIRDTHTRHRKGRKLATGSSAECKRPKWSFEDSLSFLDAAHYERESHSNVSLKENYYDVNTFDAAESASLEKLEPENGTSLVEEEVFPTTSSGQQEVSYLPTSQKSYRAKSKSNVQENILKVLEKRASERHLLMMQQLREEKKAAEDDVDVFFHSMALAVKKLATPLIAEAKLKVCSIVYELEMRAHNSISNLATDSGESSSFVVHEELSTADSEYMQL